MVLAIFKPVLVGFFEVEKILFNYALNSEYDGFNFWRLNVLICCCVVTCIFSKLSKKRNVAKVAL